MNMNLKKIIQEEVNNFIFEKYNDEHHDIYRDILYRMLNRPNERIRLMKIKPTMYQKALDEFIKFGEIVNYPVKYINDWKNIIIENTILLDVITMFWGHTPYFDIDEFNDAIFDENEDQCVSDWSGAMDYLDENGYMNVLDNILPKFSNGHELISDFGLEPLQKIVMELMQNDDPNKILVLINKALDISHQRSDLSELFIEGGQGSLNKISGINENLTNESLDDYSKWKRKNVTLRGIKKNDSHENDGMAKYGQGLYTAFLGNRSMAREYGDVYFVVNAIPKKPKIVNSVNEAEIFLQELVTNYCKKHNVPRSNYYFSDNTTIAKEMQKLGYDGLIIKGREIVNYKPENAKYFKTENELRDYYENLIN
jgi:hypothetical protein